MRPYHSRNAILVGHDKLVIALYPSGIGNSTLESFLHFPLQDNIDQISLPCPAHFLTASCPSPTIIHLISIEKSHSVFGQIFIYGDCHILW